MLKIRGFFILTLLGSLAAQAALAGDLTGRLGLTGTLQAGIPLGSAVVRGQGQIGSLAGAMLRYGISKHMEAGIAYHNVGFRKDFRIEPITANLLYTLHPGRDWTPVFEIGAGASSNYPDKRSIVAPAGRAAVGLEFYPCRYFAIGPQASYSFVADRGGPARGEVHALGIGLAASVFFGGKSPSAAPQTPKAPEAAKATPPPAPAPVSIALDPTQTTLGPAQSQTFEAKISGTRDGRVAWSLNPNLGSVSSSGVYTAPASIALNENVTITATSLADPARTASSIVHLTAPEAAKEVSMRLNILFDTGKSTVKDQYDPEIQKVADFMKNYPSARAVIEGHTDNRGSETLNMTLSQERADAVKNVLIQKFGIAPERLSAKGYGPTRPVADNQTAAGRAQNRRVVASFSTNPQ